MSYVAIRIIREEHHALSAMLSAVLLMLSTSRSAGTAPDFPTLRAVLFYLDEFPERRHHRKESELLFPKLRARTPMARDMLDRLDEDHARGERRIRDLEHALLAYEVMGETRREAFEQAARQFVEGYLTHMALEEREILPLAERTLDARDWGELDKAFAALRDPLTGQAPDAEYRALFERIVALVPPPIGQGARHPGA